MTRSERSNGPDTALYKKTTFTFLHVTLTCFILMLLQSPFIHANLIHEPTVHLLVGIQNTQISFVIPPVVRHDFRRSNVNSQFFVKLPECRYRVTSSLASGMFLYQER